MVRSWFGLAAIFELVEEIKEGKAWMKDCYLWLYRGRLLGSGILDDIEMAVPLSPEELLKRRRAIFKHQSQKDSAVFPGNDARGSSGCVQRPQPIPGRIYNQLGLANTEAMEAFVRAEV